MSESKACYEISDEKFKILSEMTIELAKLKLNECPHLEIKNFASGVLGELMQCAYMHFNHLPDMTYIGDAPNWTPEQMQELQIK